jgi:hypothetical protein
MVFGWGGADPNQVDDGANQYELSTRYTANDNITITAVRVWATESLNFTNRNARIWTTTGTVQRTIDIDDTLPTDGWTEYELSIPLEVTTGTSFDVSYATSRYYGAVAGNYPTNSSDDSLTAISGFFIPTPNQHPDQSSTSFYGIDVVFSLTGGNTAPEIGITALKNGLSVTTSATVTDEVPAGVTIVWDWGDGTTTSTGAGVTASAHTYTTAGLYAIVATATDTGGLTGYGSTAVSLSEALNADASESWITEVFDAVVSDVQRSGYFRKVNQHEPKKAPTTGLWAAIWVQSIEPVGLISGLQQSSALLVFTLRIYSNMLKEPQDAIDPEVMRATSNVMRRYHDDFDFEGLIRNIDVFGQAGVPLSAQAGYQEIDGKWFRIMDITVPCLLNDIWPQVGSN